MSKEEPIMERRSGANGHGSIKKPLTTQWKKIGIGDGPLYFFLASQENEKFRQSFELDDLISEIENISTRFIKSDYWGMHLKTEDEALFKQKVMEAMTVLDEIFGDNNKYSINIVHTVNQGSGGFIGGPSLKCLLEVVGILKAAQKHAIHGVKLKKHDPTSVVSH